MVAVMKEVIAPQSAKPAPWIANQAALKRAIKACRGGFKVLANRSGVSESHIAEAEAGDEMLDADLAPDIERACGAAVRCEDLRSDLHWFRDGAGEVIGYAKAISDLAAPVLRAELARQPVAPSALVDGKWDALSYRAGMLYGVSEEECQELREVYGDDRDWTNPTVLESFAADIDAWKSDGAHYQCYGMLWDLNEDTRESLLKEAGAMYMRDWDDHKSEALWEKAQAIRVAQPNASSVAAPAFAAGVASTARPTVTRDNRTPEHVFTLAHAFNEIPTAGMNMFSVNPGMPNYWKVSELSCMLDAFAEVAFHGVETPITSAQAWMLERNLLCAKALVESIVSNLAATA